MIEKEIYDGTCPYCAEDIVPKIDVDDAGATYEVVCGGCGKRFRLWLEDVVIAEVSKNEI